VRDRVRVRGMGGLTAGDGGGARIAGTGAELLDRLGAFGAARLDDRAVQLAGAPPMFSTRLQHIAAEAADRLLRRHPEQPLRLGIEVADDAVLVDRVNAFDDTAEHRTRLGLAPAQRA